MATIRANGIDIHAEERGDPSGPAILLIRGLGTQMSQWPEVFLDRLGESHRVLLFDNRDVGLSQKLDEHGAPDLAALLGGGGASAPYLLSDMAADCVGVLDHFGVDRAHVFGISMGGMIAQELAAGFPDRVQSLISVMSTSGDPSVPPATPEAMRVLMERPERPDDRDCVVEHGLAGRRVIGSPGFVDPDDVVRAELGAAFDRCHHPVGVARQMAAVTASGSRADRLPGITAPTLVIHGLSDPLVHPEGGRDTAKRIPGARLVEIEGMGHDLPSGLMPRLAALVLEHVGSA